MGRGMTLAEIAQMDKAYITPTQAAPVLGCDQYWISLMAQTEEGRQQLGFRVIRLKSRTKIPRIPFLRFMGWEGPIRGADA